MLPSLNLNFAETKKLDKRVTFTRNSVGTYFDRNGILKTANANIPRFDHDPITKSSLGLLVEETRTNVFRNTYTVTGGGTITDGTAISPDGSLAKRYSPSSAVQSYPGTSGDTLLSATLTNGSTYDVSYSGYFKNFGATDYRPYIVLVADNGGGVNILYALLLLNASNGTTSNKLLQGGWSELVAPTMTLMPCGMYKFTWSVRFTQDATARNAIYTQIQLRDSANSGTYTGDVNSGIQMACVQAELGAFPTSYIPTTTTPVQRFADVATMTGTNFSSWYNQSEGTFVTSADSLGPSAVILSAEAVGGAYRHQVTMSSAATVNNSNLEAVFVGTSSSIPKKYSYGYKTNDIAAYYDGTLWGTDGAATIPINLTQMSIGKFSFGGGESLNGHVSSISYYPKRLTNDQLRSLSLNQLEYYPKESQEFNFGKGDIYQPNIQFTRNDAVATYFDKTGVMRTAINDQPRIDYDPLTLECRGLLMEPSRTNHLTYTGDLTTGWNVSCVKTLNYGISPDGTNTSILLNDDNSVSYESISGPSPLVSISVGTYYCASVYVKKDLIPRATRSVLLRISFAGGTWRGADIVFDTMTGEYQSTYTSLLTGGISGIQDCGLWWRVYISASTTQSENTQAYMEIYPAVGTNYSYNATTTGSVEIWGTQFETGLVPTSYIACPTTSVTRQAENCIVSGTSFTNWFNTLSSAEYTVLCSGTYLGQTSGTAYPTIYSISNDSAAERIHLTYDQNFPRLYVQIFDSTEQMNTHPNNEAIVRGTRFNHGLTVGNGTMTTVLDNRVPVSVSGKTLPSVSILRIGAYSSGGNPWHGYIDKIMIYGEQVPTSKLQEMVSDSVQTRNTPTLAFHFDRMSEIPRGITFTRADATTCATYFDKLGVMRTAAANVPRFDYDPVTLKNLGLLVEESRTNLLTYSDQFDHTNWSKVRASSVGGSINAMLAPDGTQTAEKIVEDNSATTTHYIYQPVAVVNTTNYTWSVYVKAGERGYCAIQFYNTNSAFATGAAYFDLVLGVTDSKDGTVLSSGIQSVGNGWYRIWATATATASVNGNIALHLASAKNTTAYTGDNTSGLYAWGAQLEAGAFQTSYIPTTTSTVTRAADVANMTGSNFTSWFNKNEGSIIVRGNVVYNSSVTAFPRLVAINDDTGQTECIQCLCATAGNNSYWSVWDNSLSRGYTAGVTTTSGSFNTIACSYDQTTLLGAADGVKGSVDPALEGFPTVNRLGIGNLSNGSQLNGHVSKFIYYAEKLSEDQLRDITRVTY